MNFDRSNKPSPSQNLNSNQVVLQSRLRVSQSGIEMLDFIIPLGMVELHCSCPIPDEGTEGAPVYVHIKPVFQRNDGPPVPRMRRSRSVNRNVDDDYQEVDEGVGNS